MPLFSEHINNMYYSGSPSYSAPYSYTGSVLPLGSSYSASYLNPGGSYSTHSSLSGYSRAPLSSRWMSGGRTYSPILGTITERGTSSPVRINSPRRLHIPKRNYVPTSFASRPININTADIDVSRDKYRTKIETVSKPQVQKEPSPVTDNGPFMPRVDGKPETGVDSSPGIQRSTIRRGRTVVRLHTIKRKDRDSPRIPKETKDPLQDGESNRNIDDKENILIDEPTESIGWRERLSEDLTYIDKREKKSLGTKLVEKFIVKDKDLDETIPVRDIKNLENSECIQSLPVSPSARRKFSLNKSPIRRCSMELLNEQADLLDSLIKSENLSVATLDLTKVGLSDETENMSEQTTLTKRRKSNDSNSPLQTTKSDQSLHKTLKCKEFNQFSNKMKSIKKSSSGGSIRRLDSITEFSRESVNSNLPSIEENRVSIKRNSIKTKTKPKLKQKITSSVEICEPEPKSPLKFFVESVTVEENTRAPKKEFIFSAEVIEIPLKRENTLSDKSINKPRTDKLPKNKKDTEQNLSIPEDNQSDCLEPENGNFWDKIGKRETVYLMKRKQWLDDQKAKHRRALFWFPEDEESNIKEENDLEMNDDLSDNLTPQINKENNSPLNDNVEMIIEKISNQEKEDNLHNNNKNIDQSKKDKKHSYGVKKDEQMVSDMYADHGKDTKIGNKDKTMVLLEEKINLKNSEIRSIEESKNKDPVKDENEIAKESSHAKNYDKAEDKIYEKLSILEQTKNFDEVAINEKEITDSNTNKDNEQTSTDLLSPSKNNSLEKIVETKTKKEITTSNRLDIKTGTVSSVHNIDENLPLLKKSNSEEKIKNTTKEVSSKHNKSGSNEIGVPLVKNPSLENKVKNKSIDKITGTIKPQVQKSSTEEKIQIEEECERTVACEDKQISLEEKVPFNTTKEIPKISKPLIKKSSIESIQNTEKNHKKDVTLVKKSSLERNVLNKSKDETTKKTPIKKTRSDDEKKQSKDENIVNILFAGEKPSTEEKEISKTPVIENKSIAENRTVDSVEQTSVKKNKTATDTPKMENSETVIQNDTSIVIKEVKSQISGKQDTTLSVEENATKDNQPCSVPAIPTVIESKNIPSNSKEETVCETSLPTKVMNEEKKANDPIPEKKTSIKLPIPSPIVLPLKKKPVKDEPAPRPLIATPRPLQKKVPQIIHSSSSSESSSEEESSEEEDDSDETESSEESTEFFECENNPDGRTSTGSNDSGFDSSVPTSPAAFSYIKKRGESPGPSGASAHTHATDIVERELEQSTAYGLFRKTGRFTPPARSIPRFRKYNIEDFNFIKVLGKGSFGKVLLAELRDTEYYYAVKCLKKDVVLEDDDVECTLIERKVLALGTNHPYLCHLFATFQTDSHLFFVMEYLNGGDLMFHIQQSGRFPEVRARFYGAEIVSGLKFLHKRGIVYRDLKLDNILLDFDGHVRIADFGMCKLQIYLDKTADTFCGTPDYMAPEIIKGLKYNQTVDWWSFGVLLYEMLIGQSPFSGCDEDELFWSICNEMPSYPRFLSAEALSILTRLLDKDARTRLGGVECMHGDVREQTFFHQIHWDRLERRELDAPFKPRVRHPMDTQYFDKVFTGERPRLTAVEPHVLRTMDQEAFRGFSYTNPNATDR